MHQLLVKVSGWQCIDIPISVDKIGVFFREVWPSNDTDLDLVSQLPLERDPVRFVFVICLSDVQKVVNVRSALVLRNTMEIPLEVKLVPNLEESHSQYPEKESCWNKFDTRTASLPVLPANGHLSIPIHLTSWDILVRPQHWGVQYCNKHLTWRHVTRTSPTSHTRSCAAIGEEEEGEPPPFRFCVSVRRENFPPDSSDSTIIHPAHTLTLYPPLIIANLLPCDIQFFVLNSGTNMSKLGQRRLVTKGKEIAVYSVNPLFPIEFNVALENFERCHSCLVSPDQVGMPYNLLLEDYKGRPLRLTVTTATLGGSAMKVYSEQVE